MGTMDDNYLGGGWARNAQNVSGRVRYDRYLTPADTLWVTVLGRHDPFAGLDFRLQGRAGYARDVFREENHLLTAEVGYDFTIDWQIDEDPTMPSDPNPLPQHSLILNLAYANNISDSLTFGTSLEALFDLTDETGIVSRPEMPPFPQENNGRYNLRLTSESTLGVRIDTSLAVQLKVKLIYDADPVPGREPLDVATTLNMVLTLI
jgi:putative salt-induced outer membrane protein YdiY